MCELSFLWFLQQASHQNACVPLLEVGLCHGSILLEWFHSKNHNMIVKKSTKYLKKTKSLLNMFSNKLAPNLSHYNPDQVACYIYFDCGLKTLKVREVEEIAESQLHALRVRSVHLCMSLSHPVEKMFSVKSWLQSQEILCELKSGSLKSGPLSLVNDTELVDPVLKLNKYILQVFEEAKQGLRLIECDIVFDQHKTPFIVNIRKIIAGEVVEVRAICAAHDKTHKLLLIQTEDSYSISNPSADIDPAFSVVTPTKALGKKISSSFLSMIAKTIEKSRKKEHKLWEQKLGAGELSQKHKTKFQVNSYRTLHRKNRFSAIEGLIYYLEKTRPRVWERDGNNNKKKAPVTSGKISNPSKSRSASCYSSAQMLPSSCILPPLQASLRQSERYSKFLDKEYCRIKSKQQLAASIKTG